MTKTLEQKCVAALAGDPAPTLDRLLTLVAETEAAIVAADNDAELARAAFFDPVLTPDVHIARDRMESTQHTAARLRSLLPRLEARCREIAAEKALTQWRSKYEALERERDALAKELRDVYPAAATRIADVLCRAADLDRRLSQLHQSRPSGGKGHLKCAESTARGLETFTRDAPNLTRELRLPDWIESSKLIWPPRELPASVLVSNSVAATHDPRRYSRDWREALREETDRRVADEQKGIEQEVARAAEDKAAYERSLPK